jgi:radical SAM protein with 4Fe4S-binding SPASM domain
MQSANDFLRSQGAWLRHALRFLKHYILCHFQKNRWIPLDAPAISVENTSVCNSRCVFCPNGLMERPRQQMKMDVFTKAVDEAIQMGSTDIDLFVTIGDPLLDPHLLERGRYIRQFPQVRDVGFNTTLQWLHLFNLDEFFGSGFTWVHVSTVLCGRESYRNFFGVDKYDQMLANLVTLLEENNRRSKPINVEIGIKPTPERRDEILSHPDFKRVQTLTDQDLAAQVRREDFFVCDWGGSVQLPSYLHRMPLWPRRHRPCYRLFQGLMLFSNGKVGACACRDFEATSELILGSVEENSLAEMWHGKQLQQIRADWRTGKKIPDVCRKCRSYDPRAVIKEHCN